ncbi:MAG: ATP-binding protein, partial [Vicinamibacterales bacterium]
PAVCGAVTPVARSLGDRASAEFPLVAGGALLGVAAFGSRRHGDLDADALEFLQALSNQIAAAHARALAGLARRESEERLQQAARIAQLGTFELDFRTGAVLMNDVGLAIHGWAPGTAVTLADLEAHFHPDDRERVMRVVRATLDPDAPDTLDLEHRILREDGALRWVRVRGRAIFDSSTPEQRAVRAIGIHVDITDEKLADERNARLLEAERAAREEAERVGRMKDEFLATLSHELRTPLTAILGWSQLLRRRDMRPDETARAIDTIDRNARAQAQLIDDLLDMSRVVSGRIRIDMHPIDLVRVVNTAVESIQPTALAHGVELTLTSTLRDVQVLGDAGRLQQVLWNLLSNAMKFTPRGGSVAVTVDATAVGVAVTVADTGVGIDPNFLPHIFEPFSQQDASSTRRHGGVGLGLSIVKHLVELHGGDVHVSSAGAGKGSRFQVILPTGPGGLAVSPADRRRHAREAADAGAPEVHLPLLGIRLMIVEDDPDARDLLCRLLQRAGAAVVVAGTAEEALRRLPQEMIDVLVSDIGMPDMDGYELIRRIRASGDPLVAGVCALAVTAYARIEDRDRALGAGYNRYLPKPIDAQQLIAIVSEMARRTADRRKH